MRLADSVNVFDAGPAGPGTTVNGVDFTMSIDAGIKYKGLSLQTEIYYRWLNNFAADGPLPVTSIHDRGFYLQGSVYPCRRSSNSTASYRMCSGSRQSVGSARRSELLSR